MKESFGVPKVAYKKEAVSDTEHALNVDEETRRLEAELSTHVAGYEGGLRDKEDIGVDIDTSTGVSKEQVGAHFAFLRQEAREALRAEKSLRQEYTYVSHERRRRLKENDTYIRHRSDAERAYLESQWCSAHGKNRELLTPEERELMEEAILEPLVEKEANIRKKRHVDPMSRQFRRLIDLQESNIGVREEALRLQPEAFYPLHAQELKGYARELDRKGGLAETPYVRSNKRKLLDNVQVGIPTVLEGDLGSGKTELAISLCENDLGIKDPYILSFQKDTDPSELYGKTVITVTGEYEDAEIAHMQMRFLEKTEEQIASWKSTHPDASAEEVKRVAKTLHAQNHTLFEKEVDRNVVTEFRMGQIYKAMEEGKPVILDEFNAAPHTLLISLNHLLTRRPGDTIRMQQDSNKQITIKKGFAFILTGNMGDRYSQGREKMDAAFLSRIDIIKHDYLPQSTSLSYDKYLEGQKEAHAEGTDTGEKHELFDLLVAMNVSPSLTTELTHDEFRQLWNLAKGARILQENFSGTEEKVTGRATHLAGYRLKKTVPSIRNLKKVIDAWKADEYAYPLDYYLYTKFISQATEGADRAFIFSEFKTQGFFTDRTIFDFDDTDLSTDAGGTETLNPNFACNVDALDPVRGNRALQHALKEKNVGRKVEGGARYVVDKVYGAMPLTTLGVPENEYGVDGVQEAFNAEILLQEHEMFNEGINGLMDRLKDIEDRLECVI